MKKLEDFRINYLDRGFMIFWAIFSGIVVFIQSYRWVALNDYSYLIETAYKLYSGYIPFRDFMTPYPPGYFYVISLLMKVFGLNNFIFKIYAALLQVIIIIFSYVIFRKICKDQSLVKILLLPLAFIGQAMLPFPTHDAHAFILVLAVVILFISIMNDDKKSAIKMFFFGALLTFPTFFKQNIGLGLIAAIYSGLLALMLIDRTRMSLKNILTMVAGSALVFSLTAFILFQYNLLGKVFYDMFSFPAKYRNPIKSSYQLLLNILSPKFILLYVSFFITIVIVNRIKNRKLLNISRESINWALVVTFVMVPILLLIGFTLKSYPNVFGKQAFQILSKVYRYFGGLWYLVFIIVIILLLLKIKFHGFKALNYLDVLSVMIILISYFQLISHYLLSANAIWPLLLILLIYIKNEISAFFKLDIFPQIRILIFIVSAVYGFWLFTTNSAWDQDHLTLNFRPPSSTIKNLTGLACEGNVIPIMDNMFKFVEKEIPFNELVATIPGEDPFYFATGRKSVMSYMVMNDVTYDYDTDRIWNEIKSKNILWIILKKETQGKELGGYIDTSALFIKIKNDFRLYARISGYEIYKFNK